MAASPFPGPAVDVVDGLTTTFASRYTRTVSLAEVPDPVILLALDSRATGAKFLIDPTRGY